MSHFEKRRILVKELISSRYETGTRPRSWDQRVAGIDKVRTADGEQITLLSSGQQSPPQPGWTLLLTGVSNEDPSAMTWTLYGIAKAEQVVKSHAA